jgi:hypothetical protein
MKEQIPDLFEDGDRALIAVDIAELSRIFADDYVQYDESARALANKTWSTISVPARAATLPCVPPVVASDHWEKTWQFVQGSEEDEIEQGGRRSLIRYVYTDIVMRRDGKWQSVASQLARPVEAQAER